LAIWRHFCRLVTKVFYRKVEVLGEVELPESGRPLARSGLFKFPMKVVLGLIGAVPVYRPQDGRSKVSENSNMFRKCHALLGNNECIIIFPEGQSHSDPHLHQLKSGAARIALGSQELNGCATVIPIGLTFTRKGQFRSRVLVHFGNPVDLEIAGDVTPKEAIALVNQRITSGLVSVTLNADSWEDIEMVTRLERFFSLRHGKYRSRETAQGTRTEKSSRADFPT